MLPKNGIHFFYLLGIKKPWRWTFFCRINNRGGKSKNYVTTTHGARFFSERSGARTHTAPSGRKWCLMQWFILIYCFHVDHHHLRMFVLTPSGSGCWTAFSDDAMPSKRYTKKISSYSQNDDIKKTKADALFFLKGSPRVTDTMANLPLKCWV